MLALTMLGLALQTVPAANAAKWQSCPAPPFPTYPSIIGATSSPFIQPGRDLTIVLNEQELAETGGFSQQPQGNEIRVRFVSPFGPTLDAAPILTDASPASLTFEFPETILDGAPIVGPVEILVVVGSRTVAHIGAESLVALPSSNDVEPLLFGPGTEQVVLGAVGMDGDLWVPARFDESIMEKPTCPGDFIFPVSIQVGAAEIDGIDGNRQPLRQIRAVTGYLGEVYVRDYSLYGMPFQNRIRLVHVGNTLGVSICQLNDALDIVLRLQGDRSWTDSARSPMDCFVRGLRPVPLRLSAERTLPSGPLGQVDSFDNSCSVVPSSARR